MDVWIKFPVYVLFTDEVSLWGFWTVSFDGDCCDAIKPRWYFKGDFTTAMSCCCSQFLVYIKNKSSHCMNSCLSASQLYDKEYLFCMSMLNKISVSGCLSHMRKVWGNLKLAIQRCRVALPSEDIADPSTVFKCNSAGSILVLYWPWIMLYMLVWTSKRPTPESIRALNLLPACTVPTGQSNTSPVV